MPAIFSIGSAETHLAFKNITGLNRYAPLIDVSRKVMGMSCGVPTRAGELLGRHPCVLYESAIHITVRAVRQSTPNYSRNDIDHVTKLGFSEPSFRCSFSRVISRHRISSLLDQHRIFT